MSSSLQFSAVSYRSFEPSTQLPQPICLETWKPLVSAAEELAECDSWKCHTLTADELAEYANQFKRAVELIPRMGEKFEFRGISPEICRQVKALFELISIEPHAPQHYPEWKKAAEDLRKALKDMPSYQPHQFACAVM